MTHSEFIDSGIDKLIARNPMLSEFTAARLARVLRVTRTQVSVMLQVHRQTQRHGATRYNLGSRGYGRAAVWYVMSGNQQISGQRLTLGHAKHIARDLQRRAQTDLASELSPAALQHPVIQVLMAGMESQIRSAVIGMVTGVNASLDLIEQTTGMVADKRGVA